jgi:biopolymer transport protein ExbD
MKHRHKRRCHEAPEIDVTAFMNLMVVLIPFLLLSASFNYLTMFELYLPVTGSEAAQEQRDKRPDLSVVLRSQRLELQVQGRGTVARVKYAESGLLDTVRFQAELRKLKSRYPTVTQVTLLSEPEITYERIIEVMDSVRAMQVNSEGIGYRLELFPDIALGEAPAKRRG